MKQVSPVPFSWGNGSTGGTGMGKELPLTELRLLSSLSPHSLESPSSECSFSQPPTSPGTCCPLASGCCPQADGTHGESWSQF